MLLICFSVSVTGSSIKLLTRIADKRAATINSASHTGMGTRAVD